MSDRDCGDASLQRNPCPDMHGYGLALVSIVARLIRLGLSNHCPAQPAQPQPRRAFWHGQHSPLCPRSGCHHRVSQRRGLGGDVQRQQQQNVNYRLPVARSTFL